MFIAARISYIRGHMFTGKYVHQYGGQLKWDHLTETIYTWYKTLINHHGFDQKQEIMNLTDRQIDR